MNDVTHLGFQDIPMLSNIPNLVYLAPTTKEEYIAMLDWSIEQNEHPVAIKLPGGAMVSGRPVTKNFGDLNKYEVTQKQGCPTRPWNLLQSGKCRCRRDEE